MKSIKQIASEVYKSLNNLNPTFMTNMFEERNSSYYLRDSSVLTQPIFKKLTYGLHMFNYYGANLSNMLPNDLKKCTSITNFKEMIKH